MAKGKKSKGTHYTSKGLVGTDKKLRNSRRRDRTPVEVLLAKWDAYYKGKNAYVTIDNPNPHETRARKIRVKMTDYYGPASERIKKSRIPMKHETE